jgi:hypothetical protein
MHEKLIDDMAGLARQFHRLIDPRKTTDSQAEMITVLSSRVMQALRTILQPSEAQLELLRVRINEACNAALAEQKAEIAQQSGTVN